MYVNVYKIFFENFRLLSGVPSGPNIFLGPPSQSANIEDVPMHIRTVPLHIDVRSRLLILDWVSVPICGVHIHTCSSPVLMCEHWPIDIPSWVCYPM